MDVGSLSLAGAGGEALGLGGAPVRGGGAFGAALERAVSEGGEAPVVASEKAREAAEELVSAALVRPVLARMRSSNTAQAPFAPGVWEKTFGPMLDAEMSSRIVQAGGFDLVDRLAQSLTKRSDALASAKEGLDG